ncbi:MAG TPA: four helix bundle protein [Patescibacteria group bacterium]|nr:four helix bundle protein [Patescibacteria group bacterium]
MSTSYKDLIVWQKAILLVKSIYYTTEKFPKSEIFGLSSQMRRAAVSITSNIAEGRYRSSSKENKHFYLIAFGSGAELETQLIISKELGLIKVPEFQELTNLLAEVMKMLNVLISKLSLPKA